MGVTLNNTGDSGSVNITLNYVVSYTETHVNRFASKSIPGKVTPSIDANSFVKNPTTYNISAIITDAEKVTLQTLANEEDKICLLSDNEQSSKSVRPTNISFSANVGDTDLPWRATIQVLADDH